MIRGGRSEADQRVKPREQGICNWSLSGEDIVSSVPFVDLPVATDLMAHIVGSLYGRSMRARS